MWGKMGQRFWVETNAWGKRGRDTEAACLLRLSSTPNTDLDCTTSAKAVISMSQFFETAGKIYIGNFL